MQKLPRRKNYRDAKIAEFDTHIVTLTWMSYASQAVIPQFIVY
jgi:hypothetical protein